MVDKHLQNFFGNNTTMLVRSTSKGDPFIFLEFINKNGTGYWEEPLNGEGLMSTVPLIGECLTITYRPLSEGRISHQ